MWKILRSSWDLCYNSSLYFIFFFLSWERVNEYHTPDSLVEACQVQQWKISEAGFSACWKEGLSRSVPRPGSMLPSHLESLWVWGVLVSPSQTSWIPPRTTQRLMGLKATVWKFRKSEKTRFSCQGYFLQSFSFELKARWTKTWDLGKRGSHLALDTAGDTHAWGMLLN